MNVPEILEDDREINAIWIDDQWGWVVEEPRVSHDVCTGIIAYGEPGQHCLLPWFAVYNGDDIVARVPAQQCTEVHYK